MPEQIHTPPLHSKNLQTKGNTYYFDVKEAKNGNKYLMITETHMKDGRQYRNIISVFGNNLQDFAEIYSEMAEKVVS